MKYTKKKLLKELKEVSQLIDDDRGTSLDAVLTLDYLLRLPNSDQLFDETTKKVATELWNNAVAMGIKLDTPPIISNANEVN